MEDVEDADTTVAMEYTFTVTDIRNPYLINTRIEDIVVQLADSTGAVIEEGYVNIDKFTYESSEIDTFKVVPGTYVAGKTTSYTITITPPGFMP